MKINIDQKLKNYAGAILKDQADKELTLKWICTEGLLQAVGKPDGKAEELTGTELMARYQLGHRIDKGGEVELSAEEVTKIKALIVKLGWGPMLIAQSHLMLERKKLDDSGNIVDDTPSKVVDPIPEPKSE